jgi:hypothetical protein
VGGLSEDEIATRGASGMGSTWIGALSAVSH